MRHDFDRIIDRRNTLSIKYEPEARGKPADVLPLWVADMDFSAPPCVVDALVSRSRHGIFGYSNIGGEYFGILQDWFLRRHGWRVEREWLILTPGVVNAIYIAVRALTEPGDSVIIMQPVYYPFASSIKDTGRRLVVSELAAGPGGRYEADMRDFEAKIVESGAKAFILCSPHNPGGRVWSREELKQMGDICLRNGVLVIADEIHQDIVFGGRRHHVFAGIDPAFGKIAVTCTAPSKTFNLAGLQLSNIFVEDEELRRRFAAEFSASGMSQPGVMGIVSCMAAYGGGEGWLSELLAYLDGNMAFLEDAFARLAPRVKLTRPEGTYLAWLDFRDLGMDAAQLDSFVAERARLWLNSGYAFGKGGTGFMRLNAACPRAILEEAAKRLGAALAELG
ncbi:MAG: pyridoxal phosphate-dependent aminotransferase [Clostridiales bacterium]|nr:pyridoxal phosphate-dependent aminotransferase [Clostridiales bacterium]